MIEEKMNTLEDKNADVIPLISNLVKDSRLEELELGLNVPNIFSILKITHAEIRHSNFLAWLMTPNGSHNLGTVFIKWFLKEVFSSEKIAWENEIFFERLDLRDVEILREWNNIDLLIKSKKFVICIENKTHSKEHSNQLEEYRKVLKKSFPKEINKAYVFLTYDGVSPTEKEDDREYVSIDYSVITSILEIILSVYRDSLSQKSLNYIEDYLMILKRYVMSEGKSVDLAQEIYKHHKDAIDFIVQCIPDRLRKIGKVIEEAIEEEGYVLGTCNKYYARFLTEKLTPVIPKTGYGWKGEENFLFEMAYWEKSLSLKFVISPGNEKNRQILSDIMKNLPKHRKPSGTKWLTYYSDPIKVNFNNEKYDENNEIKLLVKKLLDNNKSIIQEVENKILAVKDQFEG